MAEVHDSAQVPGSDLQIQRVQETRSEPFDDAYYTNFLHQAGSFVDLRRKNLILKEFRDARDLYKATVGARMLAAGNMMVNLRLAKDFKQKQTVLDEEFLEKKNAEPTFASGLTGYPNTNASEL